MFLFLFHRHPPPPMFLGVIYDESCRPRPRWPGCDSGTLEVALPCAVTVLRDQRWGSGHPRAGQLVISAVCHLSLPLLLASFKFVCQ